MRSGIVISGGQAAFALFQQLRIIDGLVHPVPYTSAYAGVAVLYYLPVFAEIAYGVAHGVGILAYKHRLVQSAGVLTHPFLSGIHLGVEIRETSAAVRSVGAGALIMHRTRVQSLGRVVAVAEILAVAGFVAKRPRKSRRVVAVSQHHPLDTVGKCRYPALAVADRLVGVVLEVGLVHGI